MLKQLLREGIARLQAQQIDEARLDAELLLAEACGLTRAGLLAHLDDPVDEASERRFCASIGRRARHEPVAYIRGHKEFYALDLLVDRRVLIPRPETELLVERALGWLEARGGRAGSGDIVVDVGTGSGAVAIALAHALRRGSSRAGSASRRQPLVIAADISPEALDVARANAERHGLSGSIRFVQSDLLAGIAERADLIAANLPYIARGDWPSLAPDVADYEPRLALDGGADGLDAFRRFFAQAPSHLAPGGAVMLEIGWTQGSAVRALALSAFRGATVEVVQDGAGLDRVVVAGDAGNR